MANENVAQKAGKCFLPKVANAIFKYNGEIAFTATANTDSQVNIQTTTEYKRAGQNNVVIGSIVSEKTVEANFTTPEWKIEFLAANIGETIQIGTFNFTISDLQFEATAGVITLPAVPIDNVIYVEINGVYTKVDDVDSTTVDLTSKGITGDVCVNIIGCFPANGKRLNISASSSPLVGELILETPIFKGTKGKIGTSQYVFPAFALSGNWDQSYGTDATYQISGTAIATTSLVCGEGDSYGYYQEKLLDDAEVNTFENIIATPSIVELEVAETATIDVYGIKGGLYAKSKLTGATFASADTGIASVGASTGVITGVAQGTTTITVTYNGTPVDVVSVEVSST